MAQLKHPKMVDIRDILDENTRLPALVAASAEKLLGLERLNKAYDKIVRDKESGSPENFFQLASRHLNLKLQLRPGDLENIPKKGPVVVVANHPHGLSDGIMFGELLTRVREDVRILANEQLSLCQELEPWLIKVDVYEDENAKRKNLSGMRKMISWLRKGGVLGIFPAGTASSFSLAHKRVTDDPWNANIAAIIRMTKATVVPVHFPGRNSLLFQGVSLINRKARVAFLPREVGRDGRRTHRIVVGKPIPFSQLGQYDSDEALVSHLRLRTYLLGKGLDSVMNYPFKNSVLDFVKGKPAQQAANEILSICEHYPAPAINTALNFLSTHDTERALTVIADEPANGRGREWQSGRSVTGEAYEEGMLRLRMAYAIIYTLPGVPCLYYGDEIGMQGYRDPFNRAFFCWDSHEERLRPVLAQLAQLRHSCEAFRTGELRVLRAEDGILHYQRIGKTETAEIIVNRSEHIIVEPLASGKHTEVNPMGFTIVVEENGHNPNHSYYDIQ